MELTYQLTDFVTAGGKANRFILARELTDAGFSVNGIAIHPPEVIIDIDGTLTPEQQTEIDTHVTNHSGQSFSSSLQRNVSEAEESDDSGNAVTKLLLSTGPMTSGIYQISYSMEIATTTATGNTGARGLFGVNKNGSGFVEKGQHNNAEAQWHKFSESFTTPVEDGDDFSFALQYRRIGASGNAARARFARIIWVRLGDS